MEFTFAWFWIVKLGLATIVVWVAYKAVYTHKFQSKGWNIFAGILLLLSFVSPVKLNPTTDRSHTMQSAAIEQAKVLPPMAKDNSFKQSNTLTGVTKEDMK